MVRLPCYLRPSVVKLVLVRSSWMPMRLLIRLCPVLFLIGLPSLCGSSGGGIGRVWDPSTLRVQEDGGLGRIGYQQRASSVPQMRSRQNVGGREEWPVEFHRARVASTSIDWTAEQEEEEEEDRKDHPLYSPLRTGDGQQTIHRSGAAVGISGRFPLLEGLAMHLRGGGRRKGKKEILLDGRPFRYAPKSIGAGYSQKSYAARIWRAHSDAASRERSKGRVKLSAKERRLAPEKSFARLTRQKRGLLDPNDPADAAVLRKMEPKKPSWAARQPQFGLPGIEWTDKKKEAQERLQEMKALREELAREQGSPVITIAGQRRLNMTAIRLAPDFNALNLTEEEEEEVYRAEQERRDEWAAEFERSRESEPRPPPEQRLLTSLHAACISGDMDAVSRAVEEGADIHQRDNATQMDGGYNALHYASLHSKAGVVEALLRMGANVTSRTGDYLVETAMHCAGRGGSIQVIHALAKAGAQVDPTNCWDWTPLHYAARAGHVEACGALLDLGANASHPAKPWKDPDMSHLKGLAGMNPSPVQLAFLWREMEVFELFKSRGVAPHHLTVPPRAGGGDDDDDEEGSSDEQWDRMIQDSMVMDGLAGGNADSGLGERDIALLQAIKAEDFPAD